MRGVSSRWLVILLVIGSRGIIKEECAASVANCCLVSMLLEFSSYVRSIGRWGWNSSFALNELAIIIGSSWAFSFILYFNRTSTTIFLSRNFFISYSSIRSFTWKVWFTLVLARSSIPKLTTTCHEPGQLSSGMILQLLASHRICIGSTALRSTLIRHCTQTCNEFKSSSQKLSCLNKTSGSYITVRL